MKIIINILSIPLLILKISFSKKNSIIIDVDKCVKYIEENKKEIEKIPEIHYRTLVAAEDHRNGIHYGVDPISIIRCFYVKIKSGVSHGGSTIEQQFIRTITERYERTVRRKIREQIVAMMVLSIVKDKRLISKAYLHCAYFGYNRKGFFKIPKIESDNHIELISRLKYPTRKLEIASKNKKISMRINHIKTLIEKK